MRSNWQTSGVGPPRRTYELSEDGGDWLHAWAAGVRETRRVLGLFLSRYDVFASGTCPAEAAR